MANKAGQHRFFGELSGNFLVSRQLTLFHLLLAFCLLLSVVPDASAARRRVIFQLANLHQWAELEYDFNNSGYSGETDRGSQGHEFEEKYHLDIDYTILGRRLAYGGLELDLGLKQSFDKDSGVIDRSDSASGFNVEYALNMQIFERATYPLVLNARRHQKRINEPFTQSYDLVTQQYSLGMSFKNNHLPTYLNYNYSETATSGLALDRTQKSDKFGISTFLKMGGFSTTDLHVETGFRQSRIEGDALDSSTHSYTMEANNMLSWSALSQRQVLRSSFRKERETGSSTLETEQWNERLRLRLGKGLETEFSHNYNYVETPRQFRREQKNEFWVEHHLFNSLVSRYQHNLAKTDFDTGVENSWSRQLSLSYTKRLPKDSRVRLAYSFTYGETDRDLVGRTIYIGPGNPEVAQIDVFFEVTLENTDVVPGSIVVRDSFGELPESAYDIDSFGRLTKIDFSGNAVGLVPGDEVTIEYEYNVNNSIKYSTTTNAMSGSLDLVNQLFRVYGNLSKSEQDLLSGEANVSSLIQQSYLQVGVESTLNEYTLGSSYSYLNSTISIEEYAEAFLKYRKEGKGQVFSLRLTERFNTVKQKDSLSGGHSEEVDKNSVMLHMNYRRHLARNTTMTLKMFLADIRGDNIEQDEVSFGLLLESRWYKFLLRINADVSFEFYDDRNSHEEQLTISLRRYF